MGKFFRIAGPSLYLLLAGAILYVFFPSVLHEPRAASAHTAHTTRITGGDREFQWNVFRIACAGQRPSVIVLAAADDWRQAMRGLALCARPTRNFLLIADLKDPKASDLSMIQELNPGGIKFRGETVHVLALEPLSAEVQEYLLRIGFNPMEINTADYYILLSVFGIRPRTAIFTQEKDPAYAAFTASYITAGGIPVVFAENGRIEPLELRWLAGLGIKNAVWTGKYAIPASLRRALRQIGLRAREVTDRNPDALSVKWAGSFFSKLGFGWRAGGTTDEGWRVFYLAPRGDWLKAVSGAQISRRGKAGPVLWVKKGFLQPAVRNFLWQSKPEYFVSPLEGPYFSAFILGDAGEVSGETQGEAESIGTVSPYETQGAGMSGLEALAAVWILFSIFGSLWVMMHGWIRGSGGGAGMRWAWALGVLLLGPAGLCGYYFSAKNGNLASRGIFGFFAYAAAFYVPAGFLFAKAGRLFLLPGGWMRWPVSWLLSPWFPAYLFLLLVSAVGIGPCLFRKPEKAGWIKSVKASFPAAFCLATALSLGSGLFRFALTAAYPAVTYHSFLWKAFVWWSLPGGLLAVYAAGGLFLTDRRGHFPSGR
ncbi:MAG: hypothetical protein ACM3WV_05790 [Bacillota bacterium]